MVIIEAELFSILLIVAVLFDRRPMLRKEIGQSILSYSTLLFGYLVFLVVSAYTHAVNEGFFTFSESVGRMLIIVHSFTMISFILVWMSFLEKDLSTPRSLRVRTIVKLIFLAGYIVIALLTFDDGHLQEKGSAIRFFTMNSIGAIYCLTTLVMIMINWHAIERRYRLTYMIIPIVLIISLVLFQLFNEHTLFTLSSTFLLLIGHLLSQHRQFEVDPMSSAGNQQAFLRHLDTLIRKSVPTTLLVADVENFRSLSQKYGSGSGDLMLRELSAFLMKADGDGEVFRIGGNRFALCLPLVSHNTVVRLVNSLQMRTHSGWYHQDGTITFHVNVGIVEMPLHAASVEETVDTIDFLINEIKRRRRQSVLIYNSRVMKIRQRRLDILTLLRDVIDQPDKVKVYFQPIYSATNERVVAAEALMRIEDPQLGLLMPGEFIPLAESSGLISKLTVIILDKVCRFIAANKDILSNLTHVSVNISSEDISSSEATALLMQTVRNHRIDPQRICFELTESVVTDSFEDARSRCLELSNFGIKLALDDFGTGYANLESLVNIPFAVVKIDRSVVSNSVNNFQLLSLISLMLDRLGKEIVAEGVETREQLGFIQAAGVDRVQGYYFSKPIPENQFLELVRYDNAKS